MIYLIDYVSFKIYKFPKTDGNLEMVRKATQLMGKSLEEYEYADLDALEAYISNSESVETLDLNPGEIYMNPSDAWFLVTFEW